MRNITGTTLSKGSSYLFDPNGMFDIESLSILLNVKSLAVGASNVFPVTLMGTKTIKESSVIGTNILTLYMSIPTKENNQALKRKNQILTRKHISNCVVPHIIVSEF